MLKGIPEFIRSDNGSEFIAKTVQDFIRDVGAKTAYITPGSPWENGYIERFNGTLRDELLNREAFYTLTEARAMIENYRQEYNKIRPHSSLNYMPPELSSFIKSQTINWFKNRELDKINSLYNKTRPRSYLN